MLQRCKSFVECDTKNKLLTQQFSGILKLGAEILHRLSWRGYLWKNQLVQVSSGSTEMCPEMHRSSPSADLRIALEILMY